MNNTGGKTTAAVTISSTDYQVPACVATSTVGDLDESGTNRPYERSYIAMGWYNDPNNVQGADGTFGH